MSTRKVRTTFQPDNELEVGDAEYLDLKRQGLLVEKDQVDNDKQADAPKRGRTTQEG